MQSTADSQSILRTGKMFIVEDEPDIAGLISATAEISGYDVEIFSEGESFRERYHQDIDLILLDLLLPHVDGIELIRFLADIQYPGQLILISGLDEGILLSAEKLAEEQKLNCLGILKKPFRVNALQHLLSVSSASLSRESPSWTKEKGQVIQNQREDSGTKSISSHELQRGIRENQFIVYYQPQIKVTDQSVIGAEALVRWQHPTRGLIPPNLFIPIAEKFDLIDDLTWVVLKQAIHQCQHWRQGPLNFHIRISVNISAITLKSLDLPERIHSLTHESGINPDQLVLEITESALTQELIKSLEILTRLRIKKFNLSIDDFGAGYSSMVQLHRVPFSEIKIDRSFVLQMIKDHEAHAIVETVIMLGKKLGMTVIAEGVETKEIFTRLGQLGCDIAQGYFFARPMPGLEFEEWLYHKHPKTS